MRNAWITVALVGLSSCKKPQAVPVDTSRSGDIPREIAVAKLREILPTAEAVTCTFPKDSLKASEVKEWIVNNVWLEIRPAKGVFLRLSYRDITATVLEKAGARHVVKVFSTVQTSKKRVHFKFLWSAPEPAQQVVELLEALRQT